MTRRRFLQAGGALGLLALAPAARVEALLAETTAAIAAGGNGHFLTGHELDTLRAVVDRFVPGPPDDAEPGAREAGCAEAIDLLLAAFSFDPPLIHTGGPFSNRAGASHDDLADFVPLDRHAELGWRIRLEGSQGRPEREFAGPVDGLQSLYRSGLAHCDARAHATAAGTDFASLPSPLQDALLSDQSDGAMQAFVGMALSDTLDFLFGVPEYGGNRDLIGWKLTGFDGDVQPRGFTPAQVSELDPGASASPLGERAATDALSRFLPALAGERAPRVQWWRGRPGFERG